MFSALPMLFHRPDFSSASLSSVFGNSSAMRQFAKEMGQLEKAMWWDILVLIVLSGVCPFLLGLYMMRSGAIFVKICYPDEGISDLTRSMSHPPESSTVAPDPAQDDRRYMPPEMR
ncbi:hypothetical protein P0Y35_06460 [Kiritimatiellaeota bacterium B1221]|nr:hypothetical protein [Kiritimatiellaeota bacterium B1221]